MPSGRREFIDQHRLGDRDVVEDADGAEDDRREEDAPQVEALSVGQGEEREVRSRDVGETEGRGRGGRQQPGDRQGAGRPEDRREARPFQPLGQEDREDGDAARRQDGKGDRGIAGDEERQEHLEDDRDRQPEGDEGADAVPPADRHDSQGEQGDKPAQDRQPPSIADRDERRTGVRRGRDRDDDLVTGLVVRHALSTARADEIGVHRLAGLRAFEVGDLGHGHRWRVRVWLP